MVRLSFLFHVAVSETRFFNLRLRKKIANKIWQSRDLGGCLSVVWYRWIEKIFLNKMQLVF